MTAYNAIYYKALTDAAAMASELGNAADAATYAAQAADLKQRINATLFDTTRGVYKLADRDNANHAGNSVPQDANAEAISFGIAPASAHAGHPQLAAHATCGSRSARSRTPRPRTTRR